MVNIQLMRLNQNKKTVKKRGGKSRKKISASQEIARKMINMAMKVQQTASINLIIQMFKKIKHQSLTSSPHLIYHLTPTKSSERKSYPKWVFSKDLTLTRMNCFIMDLRCKNLLLKSMWQTISSLLKLLILSKN